MELEGVLQMTTTTTLSTMDHVLAALQREFGEEKLAPLIKMSNRWRERNTDGTMNEWARAMILEAISYVAEEESYWTFVAARIYLQVVNAYEERRCNHDVYQHFGDKVQRLVEQGLSYQMLEERYSEEVCRR